MRGFLIGPKNYEFEKAFNRDFGIIKRRAFKVEAELKGWAAQYAAERIWSPDQKIEKPQPERFNFPLPPPLILR